MVSQKEQKDCLFPCNFWAAAVTDANKISTDVWKVAFVKYFVYPTVQLSSNAAIGPTTNFDAGGDAAYKVALFVFYSPTCLPFLEFQICFETVTARAPTFIMSYDKTNKYKQQFWKYNFCISIFLHLKLQCSYSYQQTNRP
jgi:hypothetical protein